MIADADLTHWRAVRPWPTDEQIEQDLVLSRLIVEIARHPLLGQELVFRGGTCLHQLWMDRPWRYSEDLDFVRRTAGGVGEILDAIRDIADIVGFDKVQTDVRRHPKARLDSTFLGGQRMRIKIEMNTYERSPAEPLTTRPLSIDSPWFGGEADVVTFTLEELVATKIRALYQRRKGRDLFDMWLAVEEANVTPEAIADCFGPYRPDGWEPYLAMDNLDAKLDDERFTSDLDGLITEWPESYSIEAGAAVARAVIEAVGVG